MPSIRVTIVNRLGLHARPATAFAQTAGGFAATVKVRRADGRADGNEWVDGKSIMQMLMLAATSGTVLEISTEGRDAADAATALRGLVERQFDED